MSKSVRSYLLPGLAATAGILGVSVGLANRDYGADRIDGLSVRISQLESQVETTRAAAAQQVEEAEATMATRIEEIQAQAQMKLAAAGGGSVGEPAPQSGAKFALGREALPEEIAAWDVDVRPDGTGLPAGSGDVFTGEEVFAEKCASCHGDFAEGVDNWPVLAGGFDTLADKDPVKTVGSYWPYLSTVWDYVNRSMPFGGAQTLTNDEVYAIVAYILYSNDLVDDEFVLSDANFAEFNMYNADGFIIDDRAKTEYAAWSTEPCMEGCKGSVEITMRASVLDVTPEEDGVEPSEPAPVETAQSDDEGEATAAEPAAVVAAVDPELVAAGEKVWRKCKACHQVGDGAQNKTGPQLNAIVGRSFGAADGFQIFQCSQGDGRRGAGLGRGRSSGFPGQAERLHGGHEDELCRPEKGQGY